MSDSDEQDGEWQEERRGAQNMPRIITGLVIGLVLILLTLASCHHAARAHKLHAHAAAPAHQHAALPPHAMPVTPPPVGAKLAGNETSAPANRPAAVAPALQHAALSPRAEPVMLPPVVAKLAGNDTSAPASLAPAAAAPPAAGGLPDVFGSLREASRGTARRATDWSAVASALAKLNVLEGARVDPQTGQLLLYGTTSAEPGPLLIEDVLLALKAAFFELHSPGMTLDENPADKCGPWMLAKYFGGAQDTHFGQVMFECDRLMKCLSQGQDNLTRQTLRSGMDKFHTHTELSVALDKQSEGAVWTRFWANLATGRFPTNDVRGKSLVELSADRSSMRFVDHRMYIDTEDMIDPGVGARLVSSGGVQSRSARAFADQLTYNYAALAKEFKVFHALQELSKLAVLAEWIRDTEQPIDGELLHCRFSSHTTTPTKTPSLKTTNAWHQADGTLTVYCVGGVTLKPALRYVRTKEQVADSIAVMAEHHRSELRMGQVASELSADGHAISLIPLGPSARGPPEAAPAPHKPASTIAPLSPLRPPSAESPVPVPMGSSPARLVEVNGQLRPMNRTAVDPVLGAQECPLFVVNAETGREAPNFPILREDFSSRHERSIRLRTSDGRLNCTVPIPDRLYITSPAQDINLSFVTKPEVDYQRNEPYFPATTEGVSYYPKSRTLRMASGDEFRFDASGLIEDVTGLGKPHLHFTHKAYQDGPLIRAEVAPDTLPRGPPRDIEVQGGLRPISRLVANPDATHFDTAGVIADVTGPGKPPLQIKSTTAPDGLQARVEATPNTLPRGPPQVGMVSGGLRPLSRLAANPDDNHSDTAGMIGVVTTPGKPPLQSMSTTAPEGSQARTPVASNLLPRGPPQVAMVSGGLRPLSRLALDPGAPALTRCVISNAGTGQTVEIRDNGKNIFYVYLAR